MKGLLDFASTPAGQGLLAAAFGGLAGARRGQPINSIGRAGLAGLAGYSGAQDRVQQQEENAVQKQLRDMQMTEMREKLEKQKGQQAWREGLPAVQQQATQPTYGAGDEGPTMTPANPNALMDYAMKPNSPFADEILKQRLFPSADDYKVVGSDLVRIGQGGVSVAHQSQRSSSLPVELQLYERAVSQGYTGDIMTFWRDRAASTAGGKAAFDVMPVTSPDGTTTILPRSTVATQAGGGSVRPSGNFQGNGYNGGSASAAASDQREILTRELTKAQREGRTQDVAALQRELGRLPGGVGLPVQSEAQKAGAVAAAQEQTPAKVRERESAKAAKLASFDSQLAVIDKALNHPGRKTATGLSGTIDPRNYMAGTNAKDFQVVLEQLGGSAFLQGFESLKGGGAITEIEGQKATAAIARLNRAQSDKEFEVALGDLRQIMQDAKARMGGATDKPAERKVIKTGMFNGRKVVMYDDGSTEYAN